MKSRTSRIAVSILISLVCLYIAARGVEWGLAYEALAQAHYWWVVPMMGITVLQMYVRAVRWHILLRPLGNPPMRSAWVANSIGTMANFVLPLRAGEVIRPVLLSRRENLPLGGIIATCVLERIFDMFTILLLVGITIATLPVSDVVRDGGSALVVVAVLIAAAIGLIRWQEDLAMRLLRSALKLLPSSVAAPIERFFEGFVQALRVLDSPLAFIQVVAWSFAVWGVVASVFAMGIAMFDLPVPLLLGSVALTALVAIAVSAPSAPGFIGAFQAGCVLALGFYGVDSSNAIAYSFAVHVTQFIGIVGTGLYALASEGMSLQQMEQVAHSDDATA